MNWSRTPILGSTYIGLFLLTSIFFYGGQFQLWQTQIPGYGEDGVKNYFTAAYHIEFDQSPVWFEGMNYPDGEHVIFTDNQPLVSNLLKLFGASADLLPYLVFISMLIGGWFIFRMLDASGSPRWFALLSAIGITFLSPQMLRLGGHYSLAYGGIIPVFMYLLWKPRTKKTIIGLVSVGFLSSLVHPYLMMMLCIFWLVFEVIESIFDKSRIKTWLAKFLVAASPILLFQILLMLTDPVNDRPSVPYGFLHYRATWASIFLPLDFRYFTSFSTSFTQSSEGGFFIGLASIIGCLIGLIKIFRNRFGSLSKVDRIFLASIPVLLLACAFPFYIWKLDRLVNYLGPLQQFRGIGRFSFIFYFAAGIFAAVHASRFVKPNRAVMGIVFIGLLFIDGYFHAEHVHSKTSFGTSIFHDEEMKRSAAEMEIDEFQAILPLPYFHVGSENFSSALDDNIIEHSFGLSMATGLPSLAVHMSRTSLAQTLEHMQLVSHFTSLPKLLTSPNFNDKSLLILTHPDAQLTPDEQALVMRSQPVGSYGDFKTRRIELSDFQAIAQYNESQILPDSTSVKLAEDIDGYQSFDTLKSKHSFIGDGAMCVNRIDWTDLVEKDYIFNSNAQYELSFWFYAGNQQSVNTQLWLWERNGDEEVRFELSEVGDYVNQIEDEWILCSIPISVVDDQNNIQIMLHRDGSNMKIYIDEILLRSVEQNYFRSGSKNLNNRYSSSSLNRS